MVYLLEINNNIYSNFSKFQIKLYIGHTVIVLEQEIFYIDTCYIVILILNNSNFEKDIIF